MDIKKALTSRKGDWEESR